MPDRPIADFVATAPRPTDFDQFWNETRTELASTPAAISFEPDALRSTDAVATFSVGYTSLAGIRIFAWLCLPRECVSCPALILPPGYSGVPSLPRAWAAMGYAALQVSPRGHPRSDS